MCRLEEGFTTPTVTGAAHASGTPKTKTRDSRLLVTVNFVNMKNLLLKNSTVTKKITWQVFDTSKGLYFWSKHSLP